MNNGIREVCKSCDYANPKHSAQCYCTKYGIIIGYSKTECRGFKNEQVREQEDDN